MLRSAVLRAASSTPASARPIALNTTRAAVNQVRMVSHAISNPTLANIEQRWEQLPPQEQADLWMALRDRMKSDWHELTLQEKKAAYWIAFGPHGPRAEAPGDEPWKVFKLTSIFLIASGVVFWTTRQFAGPPPKTMSKEWQEASNEYLKGEKVEPITGISSEGYKGKGMVQSKATGLNMDEVSDDDDDE